MLRGQVAPYSTLDELPDWARSLLDDEPVARLGLIDAQGRPRVLPITFAACRGSIWSAVDQKPKRRSGGELARISWLRERPQATVTIDHYEEDWNQLAWIQVIGNAMTAELERHPEVLAALAARYRPYRESPPPGPLIELQPRRIRIWRARGDDDDS